MFVLRRQCSFILFAVILLGLILPPAQTRAAMLPPRQPQRPAAITDDGEVAIPRPAAAQPSSLPASYASTVAQQVEAEHSLGFFDGNFNGGLRRELMRIGSFTDVPGTPPHIIPLGALNGVATSLEADVQVTCCGIASISARPMGLPGEDGWSSYGAGDWVLTADDSPQTLHMHITLPAAPPYQTSPDPIELRTRCEGRLGETQCSWSNITIYDDVPGWTVHKSERNLPSTVGVAGDPTTFSSHNRATDGLISSDVAVGGGPFLGMDPQGVWSVPVLSPLIKMPDFQFSDTVTMSVRWTRVMDAVGGPAPYYSPIIKFIEVGDNDGMTLLQLNQQTFPVDQQGNPLPYDGNEPWASSPPTQDLATAGWNIGGSIGYLWINDPQANPLHLLGIDSIQFYRNGQPIDLPLTTPDDQTGGACDPEMGGNPHCTGGDPVNTYLGDFYLPAQDIAVAAGGLPVTMDRTYVSQLAMPPSAVPGVLGPGWRFNLGEHLTLPNQVGGEAKTAIYESAAGNRFRFWSDRYGVYHAAHGIYARLVANPDGTYTLTRRNQTTTHFDANGRLTRRCDAQGRCQALSYGATPDTPALNQVTLVTDQVTSRTLALSYTATSNGPRLEAVRDQLNNTVSYTYNAAGDLETVTDLHGGVTTYGYDAQHQLLTITNAGNLPGVPALTNTYTNGRVTQQIDAAGLITTLAYVTDPATGEQVTTITTTRPGSPTDVTKHHYRKDKTLRFIERNGQFVSYVTFDRSLTPSVSVDSNGRITRASNTTAGLPTHITDPRGETIDARYSMTNQTLAVSESDGLAKQFTYTAAGQLNTHIQQAPGGLNLTKQFTYTTTPPYLLLEERKPNGLLTHYTYTPLGDVERITVGVGSTHPDTTFYEYDLLGRVVNTTVHEGTAFATTTHVTYRPDSQVDTIIENYQGTGVYNPLYPDRNIWTKYSYTPLGQPRWTQSLDGRYHNVTAYAPTGQPLWTVNNPINAAGAPTVPALTGMPPAYTPAYPDANVAVLYGYDAWGRTTLITQTGILTGTFNPTTLQFSDVMTRVTRTEYDLQGRPVTTTLNYRPEVTASLPDVNLQSFTYYDGDGNVTWRSDTLGRWTHIEYDPIGDPITTTVNYEDGDPTTLASANTSWATSMDTDLVSVQRESVHGSAHTTIQNYITGTFDAQTPNQDLVTLAEYTTIGSVITTTANYDPETVGTRTDTNRVQVTRFDPVRGQLVGSRDPLGSWMSVVYDDIGRMTTTTLNCRTTANVAVAQGCAAFNPAYPDRNVSTVTRYDAAGRSFERVDALGTVSHTNYDQLGRSVAVIQNYVAGAPTTAVTNVTTLTAYNGLSQVITVTNALGQNTVSGYNGLGQPDRITDPAGRTVRTGYDGTGAPRWVRSPDGRVSVTLIDGLGRSRQTIMNYENGQVTAADGVDRDLITTTRYDKGGRRLSAIDALGRETQFRYTLRDQLRMVKENAKTTCNQAQTDCNLITRYEYDRLGNRTKIIDAKLNQQRITTYTAANQPATQTDALGKVTSWEYNALGLMTVQHDPRGASKDQTFTYDALGRQTNLTTSTPAEAVETRYDALGRRTALIDATGTSSLTYDPLGRMTKVVAPQTGTITYGYNGLGQRTGITYPNATNINYTYAPDGQLDLVKQGATTLADYAYSPTTGHLQSVTRSNGAVTSYGYDQADRVRTLTTSVNADTLSELTYQVDRLGQRTAITETLKFIPAAPSFQSLAALSVGSPPTATPTGVVAADFNRDGKQDLAVSSRDEGKIRIAFGNNDGTFQTPVAYTTGSQPGDIKTADFNADGYPDLVNVNGASTVSVLLGTSSGTFPTSTAYTVAAGPKAVAIGDLNRDGKLDLVTAGTSTNAVSILLGNGNGTFQAQTTLAVGSMQDSIALGDLNRDGKLDIVIGRSSSNLLGVFLGNGNGTFQAQTTTALSTSSNSLALGDLNRDGILDAVVGSANQTLSVLVGTASGSFQAPVNYTVAGSYPNAVAIGDMNDDTLPDVAVTTMYGGTVVAFLNTGTGGLVAQSQTYTIGTNANAGKLIDLNSDSKLDLVALSWGTTFSAVNVFLNTTPSTPAKLSAPSFGAATPTPTAWTAFAPAAGDFNNDGITDLAVSQREYASIVIMLGNGNGTYQTPTWINVGSLPYALVVGDLNRDGNADIVVANRNGNSINVLLGAGNGTFQVQAALSVGTQPHALTLGDLNRDGKLDLVVASRGSSSVIVLLGSGTGTFPTQTAYTVGTSPESVALGDLNRDGKLDLAVANAGSSTVRILLGNGDGTLILQTTPLTTLSGGSSLAIGDLNRDGKLDIAVTEQTFCCSAGAVRVFLGAGNGTFGSGTTFTVSANPIGIAIGDLNDDGANDLMVSTWYGGNAGVLINTGTGTFFPQTTYTTGAQTSYGILVDVNRDGRLDMAVPSWANNAVNIFLNTSTATQTRTQVKTYSYDGVSRLITETVGLQTTGFGYDVVGNRTRVTANGTTRTHTYNAANQVSDSGWIYDDAGNLLTDGTTTYTYDAQGRLSSTTRGGATTTNAYNGDGTLVAQTAGGTTTRLTQDLASPLSLVLQRSGGTTNQTFVYGAERLASITGAGVRTWDVTDALGSVRLSLNDSGKVVTSGGYDAWGVPTVGTTPNPFGFTGELTDNSTGLTYLRARWYNGSEGTFLGRDSFAGRPDQPATLNPYSYAWNAPTMYTDPTGNDPGCAIPGWCLEPPMGPFGDSRCWDTASRYYGDSVCQQYRHRECTKKVEAPPEPAPPPPADIYWRLDIGYIEGVTIGVAYGGAGGSVGYEDVHDFFDYESQNFVIEGVGFTYDPGSISVGFYAGFITGWSDYDVDKRTVNQYQGITGLSFGLSFPIPSVPIVSLGFQVFRSKDEKLIGAEGTISLGLRSLVNMKGTGNIGGGWGQAVGGVVHHKSESTPDFWDGLEYSRYLAAGDSSPVGPFPVPTRLLAIGFVMGNVNY
jgi:RHS repeat-associated protein